LGARIAGSKKIFGFNLAACLMKFRSLIDLAIPPFLIKMIVLRYKKEVED
jgi:hypothetical protein